MRESTNPTLVAWQPEQSTISRRPSWLSPRRLSSRPAPMGNATTSEPPVELRMPADPAAIELEAPLVRAPSIAPQPFHDPLEAIELSSSVARLSDENAALRTQVAQMAAAMARLRREVLEASEGDLVHLAVAIAERVVARELEQDPTLVVDWAREAIQSLASKDEVVIAVGKDVARDVPGEAWTDLGARIEHDAALAADDCEVRSPGCTIATGAAARLTAVAEALGVSAS